MGFKLQTSQSLLGNKPLSYGVTPELGQLLLAHMQHVLRYSGLMVSELD